MNVDPIAQQHSDQLLALIKQEITNQGGSISFAAYMQMCLYQPGLGYYSAGSQKFGKSGDFVTAPEISPLFAQALCRHIIDVFQQLTHKNIYEFGAGSGQLAFDSLQELTALGHLPDQYYIIEASAELTHRQQEKLATLPSEIQNRVVWLSTLPEKITGVVIANEVCDAMPTHLINFHNNTFVERHVCLENDELSWCNNENISSSLKQEATKSLSFIDSDHYLSEINLNASAWIKTLADHMQQGAVFIIDYGQNERSYFHPERNEGSLRCYFQHQLVNNPFLLPGLIDITADVNFTSLAEAAHQSGLNVTSFQTQADFLIAGDIIHLAQEADSTSQQLQNSSALKQLLLPHVMGERFKVLSLSKDLSAPLQRLLHGNRRYDL